MKKLRSLFVMLALFLGVHQAAAQGTTAFTYQGQLHDSGTNADGSYTMIFKLYNSSSGDSQIGSTITNTPTIGNGLFSVNLDFGNVFTNGAASWLEITISNNFVTQTLSPRVQVLPAPYALYAAHAAVADTVTNAAIMNAQLAASAVASTNIQNAAITTVQIAAGAVTNANLTANAVNATNIASGQVVKTLNGLRDMVALTNGANTVLFTNGNSLQISAVVPNVEGFTSGGTFTVPANVTRIKVELWGGGGGGGNGSSSYPGGGGGAGGYTFNVFNVTPGGSYTVTVGTGGSPGDPGTSSSFGALISAAGGAAGGNGGNGSPTKQGSGGSGGTTSGGIAPFQGSPGDGGSGSGAGGNGGSAFGDIGGTGGWGSASGVNENANGPGAGGAGGVAPSGTGGTGGFGLVVVYY